MFIHITAVVIVVFGGVYALIAKDPVRYRVYIPLGIILKICLVAHRLWLVAQRPDSVAVAGLGCRRHSFRRPLLALSARHEGTTQTDNAIGTHMSTSETTTAGTRSPAPGWAMTVFRTVNYLIEDIGGGPRVIKLAHALNFHKFITFFVILGMMAYTGNYSVGAWVYLCLHGVYGWCWLIKDAAGRDSSVDRPITFGAIACLYAFYGVWIWGLPWLFLSRHVEHSNVVLAFCICLHTLGVVTMIGADLQKTFTLRLKPGLISNGCLPIRVTRTSSAKS